MTGLSFFPKLNLNNETQAEGAVANQPERYLINSVLRASQVLEAFSFEKPSYTNAELSKELGLNKSTLTRLLYSLVKVGFLVREAKTGEYRLTHRLYRIASVYLSQLSLHTEARTLLSELSATTGETVHLAMLDEFDVLYIDKIESPRSIGMQSRVGKRVPAYCTAVGKVLLAGLNGARLTDYLNTVELTPHTPKTITDPEALREHLHLVREQGYAVDDVEHEAEVKCVAAPVRDATGEVVAGISVSAPLFRANHPHVVAELVSAVTVTAKKLSGRLGYLESFNPKEV